MFAWIYILLRCLQEHREGFTCRYNVRQLVYFEEHGRVTKAIRREKVLKHWIRAWKLALIEKSNPEWRDLWNEIAVP